MHHNNHFFPRASAVLLAISLLCSGCGPKIIKHIDITKNTEKNTVDLTSPGEVEAHQEAFDAFLYDLFASEMSSSDTASIHFSMEDPKAFGVEVPEPTWGNTDSSELADSMGELSDLKDSLDEFDAPALTTEQQVALDTLYAFVENEMQGRQYPKFSEAFSPMSGLQTQIPLVLSEYDFNSPQDVEDYLALTEQSHNYISQCLDQEKERAKEGYCLTAASSQDVREQCLEFLAPTENCLIPVFDEKIDALEGLTDQERQDYKEKNRMAIQDSLIPAYQEIITVLLELDGSRSGQQGLCSFPGGTEYYEYLVRGYTGSDKSVDELIRLTEDHIHADLLHMQTLANENENLYSRLDSYEYPFSEPEEILEHLKESIKEAFPASTCGGYRVKYVPQSLESLSNPAFYLIPPIDNPAKQVIYVNNSEEYADMDLFPTLAHEGFPGHMYQITYYNSQSPHPIRSLLGTTGYHEGWAQYAENFAYQYSGLDMDVAAFLALNSAYSYALYARADMGIHYEGWDLEETADYLSACGLDRDTAEEIFDTLINEPAAYLPYYISYLEIMELRDMAEKAMGEDFSLTSFHKFYLSMGPTYFDVMEKYMRQELLSE